MHFKCLGGFSHQCIITTDKSKKNFAEKVTIAKKPLCVRAPFEVVIARSIPHRKDESGGGGTGFVWRCQSFLIVGIVRFATLLRLPYHIFAAHSMGNEWHNFLLSSPIGSKGGDWSYQRKQEALFPAKKVHHLHPFFAPISIVSKERGGRGGTLKSEPIWHDTMDKNAAHHLYPLQD